MTRQRHPFLEGNIAAPPRTQRFAFARRTEIGESLFRAFARCPDRDATAREFEAMLKKLR